MNEEIVDVGGVALCVEAFGDAGDPAVLLMHGTGSSMVSWSEAFCERLAAEGRFVVRYDSRDAGRSAMSAGAPAYSSVDLAADAVGVLDRFGVDRGHLVGVSGGATVAQLAALEHPERIASLALACSTPGVPGVETPDLPPPTVAFPAEADVDWSDRESVITSLVEAERPYVAHVDEAAMRALMARVVDRTPDVGSASTKPFAVEPGPPFRHRLADIAAPALVIHGRRDPMFPLEHGRALAAEIPGAQLLVLDDLGHEHFPPATLDVVVPALVRHTAEASEPA